VHFMIVGACVWLLLHCWIESTNRHSIYIGPQTREAISAGYFRQFGQTPTPQQLQELVDRYVRDEICLREGLALSLDKGDEIVRRRVIQKYEFLQTDLNAFGSPTPEQLARWYESNTNRYADPERVSFAHIFFSTQGQDERGATTRAARVLERLRAARATRAPEQGDAFPGPSDVSAISPEDAAKLFGRSELTEQLFKQPAGQWSGPFHSGYGVHLVYVFRHTPSRIPLIRDIQDVVLSDYLEAQTRKLSESEFRRLRARYVVHDEAL